MAGRRKVLKMIGPATWVGVENSNRGKVVRAIVRDGDRLAIDPEFAGWPYEVSLERGAGDMFYGSWSCRDGSTTHTGVASARLYSSDGGYLLFGDWSEGRDRYHWWAELSAVDHFHDEGQG